MPSNDLDATTDVVTLAEHVEGLGSGVAQRLEDAGIETVSDILIADEGTLTDVPYVSATRAGRIREIAERVSGAPEPREVDFETTESVVSEAELPLSVRRGNAVLVGSGSGDVYHTRACSVVKSNDLNVRSTDWLNGSSYEECGFCQDPSTQRRHAHKSRSKSDLEPLVDSREVILEATVGEKLNITMADRPGYANAWYVIDAPEPVTWEAPTGDTWRTRRLRIADGISENYRTECDLVLGANIRIEDPPVERKSAQPDAPSWDVESVGAVGRASTSSIATLRGQQEADQDRPEGDDTWRKYTRTGGETA